MNLIFLAIGGVILYAVLESKHQGISASFSVGSTPPRVLPPRPGAVMLPNGSVVDAYAGAGIGIGVQAGEQIAKSFIQAGSQLANAIPIIGSVIGAVLGGLEAAHQKRIKEATDENTAVLGAVKQVDQVIAVAFNKANSGEISPSQAAAIIDRGWEMYWEIIGNHVQPGRNGCENGSKIPDYAGAGSIHAGAYFGCPDSGNFMSDWGSACCIGSTVKASLANCKWALQHPGQSAPIFKIFANKYGFPGRASYRVQYA
jgi:hypothetical protein